MRQVELLVPVGNRETLDAAINNGADAVYLGGKKFGARAYANNFSEEEIVEAIHLCHLKQVKIYVTVNTMIYNEEILEVLAYLKFLYMHKVDAVIMQDIGLITKVRKILPDLEIHVSTQAHNHNKEQIQFYKSLGIKRLVLDRELSLEEIKSLDDSLEKEIFVYGALCVCYSGNCLFSALNGGRSANRGMCTQCCRMPYSFFRKGKFEKKGYLLSMKDLNTLSHLGEILGSGVSSLKIEGRMKSKEYVACVTRIYRRLIDDFYLGKPLVVTKEEQENLKVTFNRGFTEGYLFHSEDLINEEAPNHQGIGIGKVVQVNNKMITIALSCAVHQGDAIRLGNKTGMYLNTMYDSKDRLVNHLKAGETLKIKNKERWMSDDLKGEWVRKTVDSLLNKELNEKDSKKIKLQIRFRAFKGKLMELYLSDGIYDVSVLGSVPEKAVNRPVEEDTVRRQLSKLGETGYVLGDITISMEPDLFINIRDLNELRREAIGALEKKITGLNESVLFKNSVRKKSSAPSFKYSILVRSEDQLKIALKYQMDYIYVTDFDLYKKYKSYDSIYLRLERVNDCSRDFVQERLLCSELGSLCKYSKNNLVRSDYFLNVANDFSIQCFVNQGVSGVTLSVEMEDVSSIYDKENCEVLIYGTLEAMLIKKNLFSTHLGEECYLQDSHEQRFKVIYDGFTHIFNGTCLDRRKEIPRFKGIGTLRIDLLDENIKETEKIIRSVKWR